MPTRPLPPAAGPRPLVGCKMPGMLCCPTPPIPPPLPSLVRLACTDSKGPYSSAGRCDKCMPALMPETNKPLLHSTCSSGNARTRRSAPPRYAFSETAPSPTYMSRLPSGIGLFAGVCACTTVQATASDRARGIFMVVWTEFGWPYSTLPSDIPYCTDCLLRRQGPPGRAGGRTTNKKSPRRYCIGGQTETDKFILGNNRFPFPLALSGICRQFVMHQSEAGSHTMHAGGNEMVLATEFGALPRKDA